MCVSDRTGKPGWCWHLLRSEARPCCWGQASGLGRSVFPQILKTSLWDNRSERRGRVEALSREPSPRRKELALSAGGFLAFHLKTSPPLGRSRVASRERGAGSRPGCPPLPALPAPAAGRAGERRLPQPSAHPSIPGVGGGVGGRWRRRARGGAGCGPAGLR